MKFASRVLFVVTLVLAACGSENKGAETGWSRSGDLRVLDDAHAILDYSAGGLDGAAYPFHSHNLVQVAVQDFTKGNDTIHLFIWQLSTSTDATAAYNDSATKYGNEVDLTPVIGDASRLGENTNLWKVDFRKDVYFVTANIGPTHTDAAKAAVIAFATIVGGKIHSGGNIRDFVPAN